jgi:hypothetical protein
VSCALFYISKSEKDKISSYFLLKLFSASRRVPFSREFVLLCNIFFSDLPPYASENGEKRNSFSTIVNHNAREEEQKRRREKVREEVEWKISLLQLVQREIYCSHDHISHIGGKA